MECSDFGKSFYKVWRQIISNGLTFAISDLYCLISLYIKDMAEHGEYITLFLCLISSQRTSCSSGYLLGNTADGSPFLLDSYVCC